MTKNILVFRTDRIGDLLVTCPSIKTIKEYFPDSKLGIVTSKNNFDYAKTFNFFDEVYLFPEKNILKKIKFFNKLYKKKFDHIFIFDGKDRSIITSCFLKSQKKISKIINKKQAFFCKLFKTKFVYDVFSEDLNVINQSLLDYANVNKKIGNFNYLVKKNDNNFSSKIPLDTYVQIHLDEKWFSSLYIKNYRDINPSFEEFSNFIKHLSDKNNVLITTGLLSSNLIDRIEFASTNQVTKNIFINNIKKNIVLVKKPSFLDLESILRKTKILITCHGALTHAASSFNTKIIDIIEKPKENFYKKYNTYIRNYYIVYRDKFSVIKNRINQLL